MHADQVALESLTNRLRLTWLTVGALAAFAVVGLVGPDGVDIAHVVFAGDTARFTKLLSRPGELTIRFETLSLLRAHFAADMMFLVVYGLTSRRISSKQEVFSPSPARGRKRGSTYALCGRY